MPELITAVGAVDVRFPTSNDYPARTTTPGRLGRTDTGAVA